MLLVDLEEGRIVSDEEIKAQLATTASLREVAEAHADRAGGPAGRCSRASRATDVSLLDRQQAFGYTQEDLQLLMAPMATTGQEAVGSMGTDTPISALSDKSKLLYTYFKQNFAQVTNPPIDPIREELVMRLVSFIGPRPNLFDLEGTVASSKRLEVRQPILTNEDLEKIRSIGACRGAVRHQDARHHLSVRAGRGRHGGRARPRSASAPRRPCTAATTSSSCPTARSGPDRIPIPALLATAAVHHHLIRKGLRTSVGLVVETGEAREVHHFCCLAGYGAEAINPYLAFETLIAMKDELPEKLDDKEIVKRYIKSIDKGILKVMSKMGISTYQSYCGAQIFDAVGLRSDFVERVLLRHRDAHRGRRPRARSPQETVRRHRDAFGDVAGAHACARCRRRIPVPHARRGACLDARDGRDCCSTRCAATRSDKYRAFAKILNEQAERLLTIRGLFRIKTAEEDGRKPVPLEEVEPAKEIVKRFATGAMSYGSISREAHTTLAIAMNRIGGKSNTGEGGEEADRFKPLPNGDSMRSAIKQVASGRFGVTTEYLVNSDMMQIKMAQGAKPGEGGQLPGHKVDAIIAKVRHSTPGVGLISPPPHHDIYSIEDLAQLIYDLKNVNPTADVSVKLVSEVGVGTVAAGVSKARADHVTISGFEGGTGASPLTSIKHAGSPWEIGLAETHQTLVHEPPAQPHRRAGRRRPAHRPRRRHRRAARRRRVRLRDRAADRGRLHHDAQVPPQHLPGRRRDAGSGAAQALRRPARARHQLLLLRRRGSARDHGRARLPQRSTRWSARCRCSTSASWSSTGRPRASTSRRCSTSRTSRRASASTTASAGPPPREGARPQADRARRRRRSTAARRSRSRRRSAA